MFKLNHPLQGNCQGTGRDLQTHTRFRRGSPCIWDPPSPSCCSLWAPALGMTRSSASVQSTSPRPPVINHSRCGHCWSGQVEWRRPRIYWGHRLCPTSGTFRHGAIGEDGNLHSSGYILYDQGDKKKIYFKSGDGESSYITPWWWMRKHNCQSYSINFYTCLLSQLTPYILCSWYLYLI